MAAPRASNHLALELNRKAHLEVISVIKSLVRAEIGAALEYRKRNSPEAPPTVITPRELRHWLQSTYTRNFGKSGCKTLYEYHKMLTGNIRILEEATRGTT